ncbi:haloacid dehalogenase-like hydrolase [Streptomyces diacarni]|uniref:HAD family hydrolase n=1 Tax=Streptomyces diacarni TaxID=2800381 RepID=UPI0033EAB99D
MPLPAHPTRLGADHRAPAPVRRRPRLPAVPRHRDTPAIAERRLRDQDGTPHCTHAAVADGRPFLKGRPIPVLASATPAPLPPRPAAATAPAPPAPALHVFDLDGTLLRHTTAALELARHAGVHARVQELEQQLSAGHIGHARFAVLAHAAWKDHLTLEHAHLAFGQASWLAGMWEVFADIRARGDHALVLTLGPDTFARHLSEWVDHVVATAYPAPGSPGCVVAQDALRPQDKVAATRDLAQELSVPSQRTIAYGDGPTDQPLFDAVGLAVAVNPSQKLPPEAAQFTYRGDDLRVPYAAVRAALDTAGPDSPSAGPQHSA